MTKITLVSCTNESNWLLEGEDHINAFLEGDGTYPVPVKRIRFADLEALAQFLEPRGQSLSELWSIHSNVVARLHKAGELTDLVHPFPVAEG
jgi:hypothetical protein